MSQSAQSYLTMLLIKLAVLFGVFWSGVWVFNHFTVPFVGILIALAAVFGAIVVLIKSVPKE